MTVYCLDPLRDPRWPRFLNRHPYASVFHSVAWLQALRRTYGHEPIVYTTSAPGQELTNGIPFCQTKSRLTGKRLISLPFSDHCQPLWDTAEELHELLWTLEQEYNRASWKYIQLRPRYLDHTVMAQQRAFGKSQEFYLHWMDLTPGLAEVFRSFHKSSIRRRIQRAEREGLTYEEGISETLLAQFYHLLIMTRRRHHLPPQPLAWFRNLSDCLGDRMKIRVACKEQIPVASIITLSYKNIMVDKYGCSDAAFHSLGGMPALFWQAIQDAKHHQAEEYDLGRSMCHQEGLVSFKDRCGTSRAKLIYYQCPIPLTCQTAAGWQMAVAQRLFAHLPETLLIAAGRLLYKHIE